MGNGVKSRILRTFTFRARRMQLGWVQRLVGRPWKYLHPLVRVSVCAFGSLLREEDKDERTSPVATWEWNRTREFGQRRRRKSRTRSAARILPCLGWCLGEGSKIQPASKLSFLVLLAESCHPVNRLNEAGSTWVAAAEIFASIFSFKYFKGGARSIPGEPNAQTKRFKNS